MILNKSLITNLIALTVTIIAYITEQNILFSIGIFALSGAFTNWLAIHMLFEKVPGLYGSGVVPMHFKEFKIAIRKLMMDQFFNQENIERFLTKDQSGASTINFASIIEKVDFEPAYDTLVKTIMESSFGSMLAMLGGEEALVPLKQPFIDNMRASIVRITSTSAFTELLSQNLNASSVFDKAQASIGKIVDKRLDELTPELVKVMIQDIIRQHLGWLVVWGGVFGGLIGFVSAITGLL